MFGVFVKIKGKFYPLSFYKIITFSNLILNFENIYIIQVIHRVILSNVTPTNNLLYNSYFKNPIVKLHVLDVLNIQVNFHVNWMLFTI